MALSHIYVGVAGNFGRPRDAGAVGVFRRRTDGGEWEHVLATPEVHTVFVHSGTPTWSSPAPPTGCGAAPIAARAFGAPIFPVTASRSGA